MSTNIHLTTKQLQILNVVHDYREKNGGQAAGLPALIDLDLLIDSLPYETTKQSFHFSRRALVKRDFLANAGEERRRNRRRALIDLGPKGEALFTKARTAASDVVVEELQDELDRSLEG